MNIAIIISFIVLVASILVLTFPKQFILRIGYMNTYDLETIPKPIIRITYIVSIVLLAVSMTVLMFEVNQTVYDLPDLFTYIKDLFS